MTILKPTVLVLGGGPGGYVAAIRAGQLGLDTVLVESDRLGGTCLNVGCIPSKAIIHAASQFEAMARAAHSPTFGISLSSPPTVDFARTVEWKDTVVARLSHGVAGLLKRAKVRVVSGWGVFTDAKTCTVQTADGLVKITPMHVVLAPGSSPLELPALPFGGDVISSTEALSLPALPRRLAVVGGGYIGLELGVAFRKLGCEVTVVEAQDRILPQYDRDLVAPVQAWLTRAGVELLLGAKATGLVAGRLATRTADGTEASVAADKILVAIGRRPRLAGWGLETMGVDLKGGFIEVDDRCATSMRNVWAIGDAVGEPMLEHKAAAQGHMVAEIIAGHPRRFEPAAIAAVCFTEPEIISVGLSPDEAEARGLDVTVASFPFAANGRALSTGAGEGFVRVVARKDNHRLVGVQAVGAHVSELSGEFALALEMGAVLEDIAGTIHAHPTLAEAFHESALRGLGHAIHI
jgi:dihydrolipoamide dehydrogenase